MEITRLRVSGFKSFSDPIELLLEPGLTGVVEVYRNQFAENQPSEFELSDLEATGGPVGRATARYRTGSTTGTMTWDVIRERGKPRITLIAAEPD